MTSWHVSCQVVDCRAGVGQKSFDSECETPKFSVSEHRAKRRLGLGKADFDSPCCV